MELAVRVMQESVPEEREDGKASPLVGAVLRKADGSVDTACRGELRAGDHAEFALLERKNRSSRLDEAVLFTTLEPCAKGSRSPGKLGCAERIVLARIKRVWVGIEDPDPKVAGDGIKYLRDHSVDVKLFDRDLQDSITNANKLFLAQATQRAAAVAPVGKAHLDLARPIERASMADLDAAALGAYRAAGAAQGKDEFDQLLERQGLVASMGGKMVPTGYGLILFGTAPRTWFPHAGLLAKLTYADGRVEPADFDGPLVSVPEKVIAWLRAKLPNPISRSQAKRKEVNEAFYELVREGVVNALVHRDYGIKGAKVQIEASADKLVVMSPGLPVEPITIDQLKAFNAPMLSRNPLLHFVFARLDLAEERGLGLTSLRIRAKDAALPQPEYSYKAPYIKLAIYSSAKAIADSRGHLVAQLTEPERAGWMWLSTQESASASEYEAAMGVPSRTARRHLQRLVALGLVDQRGSARATRYTMRRS